MKIFCRFLLFVFLSIALIYGKDEDIINTFSPDKNIIISFRLDSRNKPCYSISYKQIIFLNWSELGLNFQNTGVLSSGLKILSVDSKEIDETIPIVSGKSKYSRNHCNETKIVLQEKSVTGRMIELYFRAYNDGTAFRYGIPEQSSMKRLILSSEETKFNFAGNYTCWALKSDRFRHSYEGEYIKYKFSSLFNDYGDSLRDFPYVTLPLTIEVNRSLYLCLSEADITDYAGMYLAKNTLTKYSFKSMLSPDPENNTVSVRLITPALSPWRVFIIAESPGALIESNLIYNLNEPCEINNAESWVKPGKSLWSWWAENRGFEADFGYNIISTKTIKYYVDFAAQNSIEYVTIDAGWYGWFDASKIDLLRDITKSQTDLDLPYIVNYANSKGVGVFVWLTWYDLERQMEDALDYYQKIGIKGIKVDFMERDDQYMVEFYHRTAKECAKRKILVNFHGAYKPDGLERTYPNIITREAVLGNEYARWITGLPDPKHNVTIPFTRMVTGGMDYTPGSMLNSTEEAFVGRWNNPMTKGTRVQQLAMLVVYESGLITLCESPKIYENLPELNFIKQVPASWDSTIVLDGKIGRFIAIARKKGDNWFIGVMTGSRERNIEISFSFLSDGIWSAEIYSDSPDADLNPQNVSIGQTNVLRSNVKQFHMAKGGGLAMILKPLR